VISSPKWGLCTEIESDAKPLVAVPVAAKIISTRISVENNIQLKNWNGTTLPDVTPTHGISIVVAGERIGFEGSLSRCSVPYRINRLLGARLGAADPSKYGVSSGNFQHSRKVSLVLLSLQSKVNDMERYVLQYEYG